MMYQIFSRPAPLAPSLHGAIRPFVPQAIAQRCRCQTLRHSTGSQLQRLFTASFTAKITGKRGLAVYASAEGNPQGKRKVIAVLPPGGDAAKDPSYTCCVENALNLRDFLEGKDCELIVTDDKEGDSSELDKHLPDAEIVISTPFHPAYLTKDRLDKAEKLQLALTAGIGSDHVDLDAAAERGLTVAECTGSNTVSVAEDEAMRILILMRNFLPAHEQSKNGEWDVPKVAGKSRDLEGKTVGSVGGGAIGSLVMERLKPFGVKMYYLDRRENPKMEELGVELVKELDDLLPKCDVITINVPLTKSTRGMIDAKAIGKMKKGAYLVNNARGAIVDQDAVVEALESGQLGGYAGDVWPQQPAPPDHPWRTAPNNAMTPHNSGTTLDAQERYQKGIQTMLEQYFNGEAFEEKNYIVREGELAPQYK